MFFHKVFVLVFSFQHLSSIYVHCSVFCAPYYDLLSCFIKIEVRKNITHTHTHINLICRLNVDHFVLYIKPICTLKFFTFILFLIIFVWIWKKKKKKKWKLNNTFSNCWRYFLDCWYYCDNTNWNFSINTVIPCENK